MVAKQIGRQSGQPVVLTVRPAVLDRNIPSINKTGLVETLTKRCCDEHLRVSRAAVEKSDNRQVTLLRARRERPRNRRAAQQRHELAPVAVGTPITRAPPAQIRTCSFPAYGLYGIFFVKGASRYFCRALLLHSFVDPRREHSLSDRITIAVARSDG